MLVVSVTPPGVRQLRMSRLGDVDTSVALSPANSPASIWPRKVVMVCPAS